MSIVRETGATPVLDDGKLENVAFENPWWEAPWPAGWMVMVGPVYGHLARRPDPLGSPWIWLPGNQQHSQWSPAGDYLLTGAGFGTSSHMEVFTFPDLASIGRYSLPWFDRALWSPVGHRLVVTTNDGETGAAYVLDVPGP